MDNNSLYETIRKITKSVEESISPVLKVMNNLSEYINHLIDTMTKSIETVKKSHPIRYNFYERCRKIGWMPPLETELSLSLSDLKGVDDEQLNQFFLRLLTKGNYKSMYTIFENIEENIEEQYKNEITKIVKILKYDINNYTVTVPFLFSIMERMFVNQASKIDNVSSSAKIKEIEKIAKISKEKSEDNKDLLMLIHYNTIELVSNYFSYISFEEDQINEINRHAVLHGKYNPNNYTFSDYLRLLTVVESLSFFEDYFE